MPESDWDPNDREGWRYSFGGRPVELARLLVDRLSGRNDLNLSMIFTPESREAWARAFQRGSAEWIQKSLAVSQTVRYPAPGMACVVCPVSHPDQTEDYTIENETLASVEFVTLLYDDEVHDWRIHQIGAPAPPRGLGFTPFPRDRASWAP
jgi:hypothetical protein